jgi:hypothetical protein
VTYNEAITEFKKIAHELWKNIEDSDLVFHNKGYRPSSTATVVIGAGNKAVPKNLGRLIYHKPKYYDVYLAPKLFELADEDIIKILKHEAIHLGIFKHNIEFRALANKIGSTISLFGLDKKPTIQVKVGSRFVDTEYSFDTMEIAMNHARRHYHDPQSKYYKANLRVMG